MAERINVEIVSEYDDKEAKAALKDAEKLDDLDPKVEFDADVSKVLSAFDDVVAETKQVQAAADALGNALGPELAAKADTTSIVRQLQNAGLEIDTIIANADQLGAKLKEVADTDVGGKLGANLGTTRGKLDELNVSADSSKSVLANMVGNATQDLGALGGVAGSAGVAIGQMGEYMADAAFKGGNLGTVIKDFAKVAGPIAAISAGIALVSAGVSAYNKPAQEAEERTKALGKAMDDSADDALGFAQVLRDSEPALRDFIATANDPLGGFGVWVDETMSKIPLVGGVFKEAGTDIIDTADRVGFSIYDLSQIIENGGEVTGEWADQLENARRQGRISEGEYKALKEALGRYGDSAKDAAQNVGLFNVEQKEANALLQQLLMQQAPLEHFQGLWKLLMEDMKDGAINSQITAAVINTLAANLGLLPEQIIAIAQGGLDTELKKTADAAEDAADGVQTYGTSLEDLERLQSDANDRMQEMINKLTSITEAMGGAADAHIAYNDALQVFSEKAAASVEAQKEFGEGSKEHKEAIEDERDAMIDAANAAADWAEQQETAAGRTQTATQRLDTFNDSLFDQARFATPAARRAIADYIIEANQVPPNKATEITTLIEQGKFDEAERLLNEVSRARDVALEADAETAQAESELNHAARDRTVSVTLQAHLDELAIQRQIRRAYANAGIGVGPTSMPMSMPTAAPMNVNINMPRGSRGVDVLRQVSQQARRSGRRYGVPVIHYARRPA